MYVHFHNGKTKNIAQQYCNKSAFDDIQTFQILTVDRKSIKYSKIGSFNSKSESKVTMKIKLYSNFAIWASKMHWQYI